MYRKRKEENMLSLFFAGKDVVGKLTHENEKLHETSFALDELKDYVSPDSFGILIEDEEYFELSTFEIDKREMMIEECIRLQDELEEKSSELDVIHNELEDTIKQVKEFGMAVLEYRTS